MKREFPKRHISLIITLAVLTLLLLTGPAQAFSLAITVSKNSPDIGEEISFIASLDIDSGERLPITYLNLMINGPVNINCRFTANGSTIFGCTGLTITPISTANFTNGSLSGNFSNSSFNWGYGYGFGYGDGGGIETLSYNITLNTSILDFGLHTTQFKSKIGPDIFTLEGPNITILSPINITNIDPVPTCAYETDNITVSSNITGTIKEVFVQTNISNILNNHTTTKVGNTYSSIINGIGGQNISWRFLVIDIADNLDIGNWQTKYIVRRTSLSISPASPDGENNWYVTEPLFTLTNPDATKLFYQWDSAGIFNYTLPFNLTNIPNPDPKSAGILDIHYFGNTSCGLEEEQETIIKVDLTPPVITDLTPGNNSLVQLLRPNISAYIDEIYQSNSGVNKSSVIMKLDNAIVAANVSSASLDALALFSPPSDLSEGNHSVYVSAYDNAGHFSELEWGFNIDIFSQSDIMIISPIDNQSYNYKKIPLNISVSKEVDELSYILYSDKRPRNRRICKNCDSYGDDRKRSKSFQEGPHLMAIRAKLDGIIIEKNISFIVDSKAPKISKTEPRKNKVVNGSSFFIQYTEENLKEVLLTWNGSKIFTGCESGRRAECSNQVNLTDYDGQEIEYWFTVSDIFTNTSSRKTKILVDTSPPNFTINYPILINYSRRVPFDININEKVKLEYLDYSESNPRFRTLCSNCDKYSRTKTFRKGFRNLTIQATDKAGNSFSQDTSFFVV